MRTLTPLLFGLSLGLALAGCSCTGRIAPPNEAPPGTEELPPDASSPILTDSDASVTAPPDAGELIAPDAGTVTSSKGKDFFTATIQPALASKCAACHVGERFAFASIRKAGTDFTPQESEANYQQWLDLLSLDAPDSSRVLAKLLPSSDPKSIQHAGGPLAAADAQLLADLKAWIALEKQERCPECGLTSKTSLLAYVEQPANYWGYERDPWRSDEGVRQRSRIMVVPLDANLKPAGAPVDFLGNGFCGLDGRCDFGNLAVNHAGTQLAFECRLSLDAGADWVNDVRWNICIADIGADGKAVNPRFLMPKAQQNRGTDQSRSDPLGLYNPDGSPLKGTYDLHFHVRRREERNPVFSPDDRRVYFASQQPDPRTGIDAGQTYHGFEHLNHIVGVKTDGTDARTVYFNDGGVADFPFFLHNGNLAFHTWNLERMDRHLYTQSTADGMMELPVLLGRLQGPNMWGKATQLANGLIFGMTGRRRSQIDNYTPFAADHTLGLGLDPAMKSFTLLDASQFDEIPDFPNGYCSNAPSGPGCMLSRFYAEPSWAPDGRAFIAFNPEKQPAAMGEQLFLLFGQGQDQQRVASLDQWAPTKLGISLIDHHGQLTRVFDPPAGMMDRYPVWIGRRAPERIQPQRTDESKPSTDLHIADVPLWFSFGLQDGSTRKTGLYQTLSTIKAVRVFVKAVEGNVCLNDNRFYRFAVNTGSYDHPTHLGINNSTGYVRLMVPQAMGGDAYGDVPLEADRSVNLRVPAGKPLLLQGVDADGFVVVQHDRLLSLPPGHAVDTSVTKAAYRAQCASCHGTVDDAEPFASLPQTASIPYAPLDFKTQAKSKPPVDLTASGVTKKPMTYLSVLRPLFDRSCVSCHSGSAPKGELSLEKTYSTTANYPAGKWATTNGWASNDYKGFMSGRTKVPGYNWSVSYAWAMHEDEAPYKATFQQKMDADAPLAELAPWDPGYQNLFANDGQRWAYLGGYFTPNFGRSDRLGGVSRDAFLVEVVSGKDLDPTRSVNGNDHAGLLSEVEIREIKAVLDVGFPFMSRCDERTVPSGPNAGKPWGDPVLK